MSKAVMCVIPSYFVQRLPEVFSIIGMGYCLVNIFRPRCFKH